MLKFNLIIAVLLVGCGGGSSDTLADLASANGYNKQALQPALVPQRNPIISNPATTSKLTVYTNGVGVVTSVTAKINCGSARPAQDGCLVLDWHAALRRRLRSVLRLRWPGLPKGLP